MEKKPSPNPYPSPPPGSPPGTPPPGTPPPGTPPPGTPPPGTPPPGTPPSDSPPPTTPPPDKDQIAKLLLEILQSIAGQTTTRTLSENAVKAIALYGQIATDLKTFTP